MPDITIADRNGEMHVFLHPSGDHIVTMQRVNNIGGTADIMLSCDSWAWERAVRRAQIGVVFLENPG